MEKELLIIEDLKVRFKTRKRTVNALSGVNITVNRGEILGIVGESGSGKSVTSLSVMGLIASPPGEIYQGSILFNGTDLLKLSPEEMRKLRGGDIAMIFQEPMTSLNPVMKCGIQVAESIILHEKVGRDEAMRRVVSLFEKVGIPMARQRVNAFPHQLSGGLRQRVMIAMALSCNPQLLIADEPTTALDVTVEAQILQLIKSIQRETGMSVMFITHDLGVIAKMADRVVVMYAGEVREEAPVRDLFKDPKHPYSEGLIQSIPKLDVNCSRLPTIDGNVPNPAALPEGCHFHPRCPYAAEKCKKIAPPMVEISKVRRVACWKYTEGGLADGK